MVIRATFSGQISNPGIDWPALLPSFSAGELVKETSLFLIAVYRFLGVRVMNETRQLMFCLKISPTPGKENKRLDWVSHEGSGVVGGGRLTSPSILCKGYQGTCR